MSGEPDAGRTTGELEAILRAYINSRFADFRTYVQREAVLAEERSSERSRLIQEELDRRFESARNASDAIIQATRDVSNERYAALLRQIDASIAAEHESVKLALGAAERAVEKAETATEKRFEGVNEFRQQLADQTRSFPTRGEVTAQVERISDEANRLTERLGALELRLTSRLDLGEGSDRGSATSRTQQRLDLGQLVAVVSLFVAIAAVVVLVVKH